MKHNVLFYRGAGKVGNLVGYSQLGKQVFRAYQPVVRNPKTNPQTIQRDKFRALFEAARLYKNAYAIGLKDEGRVAKRTAYAQFMKENFPHVTTIPGGGYTMDWKDVIVSRGTIPSIILDTTHIDMTSVPGIITVALRDEQSSAAGALTDDKFVLYIVNPQKGLAAMGTSIERGEGTEVSCQVPLGWEGDKLYLYCFGWGVSGENYGKSTNTSYVGDVIYQYE